MLMNVIVRPSYQSNLLGERYLFLGLSSFVFRFEAFVFMNTIHPFKLDNRDDRETKMRKCYPAANLRTIVRQENNLFHKINESMNL